VIYTIDSPKYKNYAPVYFRDIGETARAEKQKKGILTHTLIPCGSFSSIEEYKLKTRFIKIRELPERIAFETSLWIGNDTIVHFSGSPVFLATIKHDAIAKSIKSIYDFCGSCRFRKTKATPRGKTGFHKPRRRFFALRIFLQVFLIHRFKNLSRGN